MCLKEYAKVISISEKITSRIQKDDVKQAIV
jgi:hypothetical protein